MKTGAILLLFAGTATAALAPSESRASTITLPGATYTGAIDTSVGIPGVGTTSTHAGVNHPGTTSGGISPYVSASVTILDGLVPSMDSSLSISSVPSGFGYRTSAGVTASMQFSMEIVGANGSVPVFVQASGGYNPNHGGAAGLEVENEVSRLTIFGAYALGDAEYHSSGNSITPPFSIAGDYSLSANTLYTVELYTQLDVSISGASGGGAATATAFVDPTFRVDAPGYSLVFSPGIGPSIAATPIPATLPLLVSALSGLGFAGWWRKRAA